MEEYKIIKNPLSTEKIIRLMEAENKLVFSVDRKAKKPQIRDAIEKIFNAKVLSVNTYITTDGKKRAYIKFSQDTPALDIATQLKLM